MMVNIAPLLLSDTADLEYLDYLSFSRILDSNMVSKIIPKTEATKQPLNIAKSSVYSV